MFASAEAHAMLTVELGSASAARVAQEDLLASLPGSPEAWLEAVERATGGNDVPSRWLFILPQNHSIVGLHPLAIAYVAGIDVTVRIPERFAKSANLLTHTIKALGSVKTVDASFRVGERDLPFDAVLAFGDDPTIQTLRELSGLPVVGFGNRAAAAVFHADADDATLALAMKDALALAQTGCLSARLLVACGADAHDGALMSERLRKAGKAFWDASLPEGAALGLELEHGRYVRRGFHVATPHPLDAPLVPWRAASSLDDALAYAAERPFVAPLLLVKQSDPHFLVKTLIGFETLTFESRFLATQFPARTTFRELGATQRAPWNGSHEGRALLIAR